MPLTVTVLQSLVTQGLSSNSATSMFIVPLCEPGEVQLSRIITVTLPPAGTIAGSAGLTTVNAGLLDSTPIVNSWLPVLLTVKLRSALVPTQTLPKLSEVGLTAQAYTEQKPETLTGEQLTGPQALVAVRLMVPLFDPDELHVSRTVTIVLLPAGIVAGRLGLVMLKAGSLGVMAVRVSGICPVLLTVKVSSSKEPAHTVVPKLSDVGETMH